MLEVVFGESAAGALLFAGAAACRDIALFPLALGFGDISGGLDGRESALRSLMSCFPEIAGEVVDTNMRNAREGLGRLIRRAKAGGSVRIWTSASPDDACGACWVAHALERAGAETEIFLSVLPQLEPRPDGTVVSCGGWGEVSPEEIYRIAGKHTFRAPGGLVHSMAECWRSLEQENAPLRAMLNGRLVSAPEDLYDRFILREMRSLGGVFSEAEAIGRVLGRCRLGISDGLAALRIESFIRAGICEPVTQPEPGDPAYHRLIRLK